MNIGDRNFGNWPEVYELPLGLDRLKVDRRGAKISLRLQGVQILNELGSTRSNGYPAVTHPCSPSFGIYGQEYGLPNHGVARDTLMDLANLDTGVATLTSLLETPEKHSSQLRITQEFRIRDGQFLIETVHVNEGKKPAPLVFGEHFYFSTWLVGWENVTVNGERIAEKVKANAVTDLAEISQIVIPGHAVLTLSQQGFTKAVCWSLPQDPARGLFDAGYFCFEPTDYSPEDFGKEQTILQPGQERTSVVQIGLEADLRRLA